MILGIQAGKVTSAVSNRVFILVNGSLGWVYELCIGDEIWR